MNRLRENRFAWIVLAQTVAKFVLLLLYLSILGHDALFMILVAWEVIGFIPNLIVLAFGFVRDHSKTLVGFATVTFLVITALIWLLLIVPTVGGSVFIG